MTQARRSLSAALPDPEEMRAFVTQSEKAERPVTTPITPAPEKSVGDPTPNDASLESRGKPKARRKPTRLQPVGLIPVTVRLRPEIAGALKRASLERQLDGEEVFSQQDLVENALEPWLREEGFLG